MLAVSASELASIQAEAVAATCDKTCQIWRDLTPKTPDAYGTSSSSRDNTAAYTLMATTVAGMSEPTPTMLQNYDYLVGSLAAWHVKMPVGSNVAVRDHLVIDTTHVLEVHHVLRPRSYEALISILAAEIV